ncbi:MAG TPA: hypothetical protein VNU71_15640 [Burkholderiaceae bacterium]|nr:hypothetical protein [Burkholderiaceae bacterium]
MRTSALIATLCSATLASAQSAPPAAARIDFPSVAAALQALEARDGNGTIVTHGDGWTIVNEPGAAAQWSFTPPTHAAYPALVRRVIRRSPTGEVSVETASLCEAPKAECGKLLDEFASLNGRITQAVRSRSSAPMAAPPAPVPPAQ